MDNTTLIILIVLVILLGRRGLVWPRTMVLGGFSGSGAATGPMDHSRFVSGAKDQVPRIPSFAFKLDRRRSSMRKSVGGNFSKLPVEDPRRAMFSP